MLVTTRLLQEDMGDPGKWGAQSQEQQTSRARQLNQDERQCRLVFRLIVMSAECVCAQVLPHPRPGDGGHVPLPHPGHPDSLPQARAGGQTGRHARPRPRPAHQWTKVQVCIFIVSKYPPLVLLRAGI